MTVGAFVGRLGYLSVHHKNLCATSLFMPDVTAQEQSEELAQELTRHSRLLQLLKNRLAASVPAGVDGAAMGVLMALVRCGARRQGELAEAALLDPSTVSRYVAQLARTGLVSRQPDPADGRAVHLVATAEGLALAEAAVARRQATLRDLLADWSPEDAGNLVRLLRRLNDEMARREGIEPPGRPGS